jgi:hypothetical protein
MAIPSLNKPLLSSLANNLLTIIIYFVLKLSFTSRFSYRISSFLGLVRGERDGYSGYSSYPI